MNFGFKDDDGVIACANCGAVVGHDGKLSNNFCAKCGNPLTADGLYLRGDEYTKERIKLIFEIKQDVDEGNDIHEILNDYIASIDEEE